MIWARRRLLTFAGNQHHMLRQIMQSPWWLLKVRQYMKHRNKESALLYKLFYIVSVDCFSKVCGWTTKHNELMKNYQSIWCPERIKMINWNLRKKIQNLISGQKKGDGLDGESGYRDLTPESDTKNNARHHGRVGITRHQRSRTAPFPRHPWQPHREDRQLFSKGKRRVWIQGIKLCHLSY